MSEKELSVKERLFVEEYLVDLDVQRAAKAAGYSATMASTAAYGWIKPGGNKPHVYQAIKAAMDERSRRTGIAADRVLEEIAKIGFSDIRKMFSGTGSLLPISELGDDMAPCLSSIEVVTRKVPGGEEAEVEHVAKVKLWDKLSALEKLGKHLGLFNEKPAEAETKPNFDQVSDREAAQRIAFILAKGAKGSS